MPDTAVLFSGGLDSAVLLADEARTSAVHPLYVSTGLAWEATERAIAARLLASPPFAGRVQPLVSLEFTVRDLYSPAHWAIRGVPPAYDTPDEDVYLVGRNLVLLAKAGIYAAQHRIGRLALGPLAGNPFPDATPAFFEAMARSLSLGLAHPIADRDALPPPAQGGCDPPRRGARGAPRPDAVVHEPGRRDALRRVQQVQGAAGRVPGGGGRRSDEVRGRPEARG